MLTNRTFGIEIEGFGISLAQARDALSNAGLDCQVEGYHHCNRPYWKRVADVEPDPQAIIPAALWRITTACEEALDLYEGFPHLYTKHRLRIDFDGRTRSRPMLYRMSTSEARALAPSSEAYLWAVAEGYRDFGFEDLTPLLRAQQEAKQRLGG